MLVLIITIILCLTIVKILNTISIKTSNIFDIQQTNTTLDSDGNKKFTICIDPGHGGFDSGTTSASGIMEKDINLKVALKLGKILEKSDVRIIYTRTTDDMEGSTQKEALRFRCDISNNADADIYVSLHCNFDKLSSKTQGTEIWCRFPNERGEELALIMQKHLSKAGYTKTRRIKYEADGGLYVLKNTYAVAVLVEMGFLSNLEDSISLHSEVVQDKCAVALAESILEYKSQK